MKQNLRTSVALKLLALFIGYSGPTVFKIMVGNIDFGVFVTYFLFSGGISIFVFFYIKNFFISEDRINFPEQFKKCSETKIIFPLLIAGLVIALAYTLYTEALMRKTVTETVLLVRLGPLFGILFAMVILKERLKSIWFLLIAAIFSVTGALVTEGKFNSEILNIAWPSLIALLAGIFIQLASVIRVYVNRQKVEMVFIVGLSMIISSIFALAWAIIDGQQFVLPSTTQCVGIVYLGFVTLAIAMSLDLLAVKFAQNFSRITFLEFFGPLFAMFWSELLLREKMWNQGNIMIGLVFISLGAVFADYSIEKRKKGERK